jgi:hypothetical protein
MKKIKTKTEWDQDIVNITSVIQERFPELSKYILEMPENNSAYEEINIKNLEDYYHSLEDIVNKYAKTHTGTVSKKDITTPAFPGYPSYPPSEDIYRQGEKEMDLNPEDLSKNKTPNEDEQSLNEKNFEDVKLGDDLDVPGSELDDQQESVGSEDEENNYYSLGGDAHNDLEEEKG